MSKREVRRSEMGLGLQEDTSVATLPDEAHGVTGAPTVVPRTPKEWLKENLFSTWRNSLLTVVAGSFALFVLWRFFVFVTQTANWTVIQANMKGYMAGPFPLEETWRIWVCVYLVAGLAGLTAGSGRTKLKMSGRRWVLTFALEILAIAVLLYLVQSALVRMLVVAVPVVVAIGLALGRLAGQRLKRPLMIAWILLFPVVVLVVRGFEGVSPRLWGGFFFNIIAAFVGIFASFPLGVLLALGRRSSLPAIRAFCVGFIELFRGVPLVAWLVISKYVLDLILPPQLNLPDIIKAFMVMTFFSAAYIGEIVRGGLQGIDRGQYEAARALGMPNTRMLALVIMPQALRSTIPAMISHFISLFKDTSLFVAIEVTDLLAAAFRSASSLQFQGLDQEVLLFAGVVFWIVAFSMSRWSQRLETRLGVGER